MARLKVFNLIACFVVLEITGYTVALRPGGRNVCSTTQQYVAYEARRYAQTRTEGYRTCCKRVWGKCIKRCTRYRTRTHVYYKSISHIRYRQIYFCCNGWAQAGAECTRPICLTPCVHGTCVAPNTCKCHTGFEGSYCRSDINECRRMGLPDGFVPTTSKTTSAVKTSALPPTPPPSSSKLKPSTKITSTTNTILSSSSSIQIAKSSSAIQIFPSASSVKLPSSIKDTQSTILQSSSSPGHITSSKMHTSSVRSSSVVSSVPSVATSASSTTHSASSMTTSHASSSSLFPKPSSVVSSSIAASSSSSITAKKSSEVKDSSESKQASTSSSSQSFSTIPSSFILLSTSIPSSSIITKSKSSSSSRVIVTSSIAPLSKSLQTKSASSTPVLIPSPSVTKVTSSIQGTISTDIQVPHVSSISPSSSSLVAVSSSIGPDGSGEGSGAGSGMGSGIGSGEGSGWESGQISIGEDDVVEPVRRHRREIDTKSSPMKASNDEIPSHGPALISYPYRCTQTCSNTVGSFNCGCYTGYYLDSDKKTCRDIDECAKGNGGCSHKCVNTVGSYRCECPHPALYLWKDRHTCKAHGMSLICTKDYMQVNFEKKLLRGLDVHHLRLTDSSCKGWANNTHLMLRTELDKCGTVYEEKNDVEIYKNAVVNRDITIGNIITRIRGIRVPFQCSYTRTAHVSGVGIQPDRHRLTFTEDGFGQFTFTMSMFHGARYHTQYSHRQYPIHVKLRDRIYFEVKVVSEDANLIVFAEKCMATPYLQRGKGPEYVFLENGCSKDSTLSYSIYGNSAYQRFSLEAFRFLDDVPNVYFHCDVIACHRNNKHSRCYQGCQPNNKRHARDISNRKETSTYNIAEGPLSLGDISSAGKGGENGPWTGFRLPQYSLFIAGIACTALLVGSVQIVKHLRSKTRSGYQRVPVHERMD